MKYPHTIKHNGKYYPAGSEVPEKLGISNEEAALRAEADALGVEYRPNIGYEKLLERVLEFKARQLGSNQY